MKLQNFLKLLAAIFISLLAGAIGSLFTIPAISTWYATLAKPAFNPPNWVFAPVWTLLFILMGVSAFLIWREGLNNKNVRTALVLFIFQLIANIFWPMIFFGIHNTGLAFIEIISLWCAILATILAFYEISRISAYLLIPYIIWVTFAGFLNYSIWRLEVNVANVPEAVACTQEAKICPDGSVVGRSGSNCEFTACPPGK
ncbi:MAG: TspO/MBR family protein [Patescibacteria group bacterium]|jgi:tryptophan-rich sensory protein